MRSAIRKAGVACGTLFASSALAVTTATGAWGSNSALVIAGLETPSLHDLVMSQLLGGALQGQQRVSVNWPAEAAPYTGSDDLTLGESIEVGITNLDTQIDLALDRLAGPGEQVTVVGLSAGSLVVNEILYDLDADANAPDADQISFIVVADSSRQQVIDTDKPNSRFDYTYRPTPVTKYDVSVVIAEFDGTHDFPDRWWHFTAVINSIAGSIVGHIPVMFEDLSEVPATNIDVEVNSEGGTTTTYLVQSDTLPLVQLLPFLASQEASLRRSVERGYSRYDNRAFAVQAAAVAAPAAVEDEDVDQPAAEVAEPAEAATEVAVVSDDSTAKDDEAADVDTDTTSVQDDAAVEAEAVDPEAVEPEVVEADTGAADAAAEAEAVEAEAIEAEAAEAEVAEAAEAAVAEDAAAAEAAEAAEAEAAEADAAQAEAAEAEAADAGADDSDNDGAGASDSSDDSSSGDSGSSDSSDSE